MGYVIVLISTLIYAFMVPLFKKGSQLTQPFTVMAISMFALFSSALMLSLIYEKGSILKTLEGNRSVFLLLIAVGLINTLGFWFAIQGYKYMPLWQQSMFGLFIPVLTGIFAYFILGETINMKLFLGLIIMGVGLFIAIR